MVHAEDFLKDQLSFQYWAVVPSVLKNAYMAAGALASREAILQVESAKDNKGRLIAWAVDFALIRAIENGVIPCDYCWQKFAKPTGRYLELRFSHSTASVSQTEDPNKQPRNVVFRENKRLKMPDLFSKSVENETASEPPHFLLIHGYQNLAFAHFAAPSPSSKKKWLWLSQNLLNIPHEVPMPEGLPATEDTDIDFEEIELLKEDIERWRRENEN